MKYIKKYNYQDIKMIMESDGLYLTGLWFENSKDSLKHHNVSEEKNLKIFAETKKWLDTYFKGEILDFTPKYKLEGITPFRQLVTNILKKIPYGKLTTYGEIAKKICQIKNIEKMSSQAVGNAVGANPICIIIPCHRVVGKNNNLTGYGGGLENKIKLLKIEHHNLASFSMPKEVNHGN